MRRTWTASLFVLAACGGGATVDAGMDAEADAGADAAPFDAGTDSPVDLGLDLTLPVCADAGGPGPGEAGVTTTETRTPCADRDPLRHVYFGDLHVHTSRSFDSYAVGNRTLPTDAYRFARGEAVEVYGGPGTTRTVRLTRPLDFAAVTDHSEFLGEVSVCLDPSAPGYASMTCRSYRTGGTVAFAVFGVQLTDGHPVHNPRVCVSGGCTTAATQVWQDMQTAAEAAYDRTASCSFTSFVAYEWSSTPNGDNLHRNVIFRNEHVPAAPVSVFDAVTALELWRQLHAQCDGACDGCQFVSIPHNSNLSAGQMFSLAPLDGTDPATRRAILSLRALSEPLVEIAQHKGASECLATAGLGLADEDCDFELEKTSLLGGGTGSVVPLPPCNGDATGAGTNCLSRDSYVRDALAQGLAEEARSGVNPFHLGFVGDTDTHNGTPGNVDEATYHGHLASQDFAALSLSANAAGALTAAWAVENSRDAIFEALLRRETYATSGPRILLRTFGGFGWDASLCSDATLVARGYAEGVPMGGTLDAAAGAGAPPTFVVQAMADVNGLAKAQIVKAWVDASGAPHTRVYDLGTAAVGDVDTSTCASTGGTSSICEVWTDPDYDARERAVYYARVLEVPSCRWTQYQCNAIDPASRPAACSDPAVPKTLEERAWSSPIWLTPTS